MDKKLLKTLNKLYRHPNYTYDADRKISLYRPETLTSDEQNLLLSHQWEPNLLDTFTHADIHERLIELQSHPALSWEVITGIFITGVGGSFPRGTSSLESYHRMIHATTHPYEQAERFICCKVCGFSDHAVGWENISYLRYVLYLGHAYGRDPIGAFTDLDELTTLLQSQPIRPSAKDIAVFKRLLQVLDEAAPEETPGQLEKRLTSLKIVKGTAGVRRGILQSLARVGVIPNQIISLSTDHWTDEELILDGETQLNNTRGRSDMEMPWAGWKGNLGVNHDQVQRLFGHWL